VKIEASRIPDEGMVLEEKISPRDLDLDTEIIRFEGPIWARAEVSRITNAVTVHLSLQAKAQCTCSRCLNDFDADLNKSIDLNYSVDRLTPTIDLNPEIREELILDYPIKPLCKANCLGLCLKCGKNLNEAKCNCK
jgi:uncharacterized protein